MQASRKLLKSKGTIVPKKHVAAATAIGICLIGALSFLPSADVEAKRNIISIDLSADPQTALQTKAPQAAMPTPGEQAQRDAITTPESAAWQETTIASGDNLTSVFKRLGLNASDVDAIANGSPEQKQLQSLLPGEQIAIYRDNEDQLDKVKYTLSNLEHYLYERDESGFIGKKVVFQPDLIPTYKTGTINNSLFLDASKTGMSQAKIMELANIFAWDIDFALDIRDGDTFSVVYDEKYLNGEKVGTGDILAATFTNQGTTFRTVRYKEQDGSVNYYTPDGKPMRKAFLRAPLDFTRISSNFNMRRMHPVHKLIKAHRGVDYAAPQGTPVYAAGNGRVIASAYSPANGNYVFIQHGGKYITKYLHLTKRMVRQGQSIVQGKTIGTVGSTGYATGPHLHYEFLVSGVHHDPRTVKLPEATPISKDQRHSFVAQTANLLALLNKYEGTLIARADIPE